MVKASPLPILSLPTLRVVPSAAQSMKIPAPNQTAKFGAIDVGHVAAVEQGPGVAASADPACILALLRALQYNTFFAHVDLSMVNACAASCWGENPIGNLIGPSDVASGPMATAVQVSKHQDTLDHFSRGVLIQIDVLLDLGKFEATTCFRRETTNIPQAC